VSRRTAALAAVGALAVAGVLAWLVLRAPATPQMGLTQPPIQARTSFSPLDPQLGDPVTATVDVFLDTTEIDPASVRLAVRVPPYRVVGSTRTRHDTGASTVLRFQRRLECLEEPCVSLHALKTFAFPDLVIRYRDAGAPMTAVVGWPRLTVHSRLDAARRASPQVRLPQPRSAVPSFRVDPHRAGVALLVAAALLGAAGVALLLWLVAAPLLARRGRVGPVERILRELQGANGDSGRKRSALEQLARELAPLDGELAQESRVLAWAPDDPPPDAVDEVARRARALESRS
jgi:hypothetical protein